MSLKQYLYKWLSSWMITFIIVVCSPHSYWNTGFAAKGWKDSSPLLSWLRKTSQTGKKGATWTPSVSLKVNISDIPRSTLVCRGQRSWWQTSDPGALRGQKRSLWNLSVEGLGTFSPAQKLQLKRRLTARGPTCGSETFVKQILCPLCSGTVY